MYSNLGFCILGFKGSLGLLNMKTLRLERTDQARLTRFFALPDSNTSLRGTISVLVHVVASQTCMVQVPYATGTGKYVRALGCGPCNSGLLTHVDMCSALLLDMCTAIRANTITDVTCV